MPLPQRGAVLGVDVGFSPTRRSSAVCRLGWDAEQVDWTIERFRDDEAERETTITKVAAAAPLEAAAFDGPLSGSFNEIGKYRTAERMLTRRLGARIGKPGQANAPIGKKLNAAANQCVRVVLAHCDLRPATHAVSIDAKAIVEAFPSSFLGLMLPDPAALTTRRGDRSDRFFQHLTEAGALARLLAHLLPRRKLSQPLNGVTNHDDRAALVCALTALSVAAGDFTAVGDRDGWIILPPAAFVQDWARSNLRANALQEPTGSYYVSPALPDAAPSDAAPGTRPALGKA